MQITLTQSEILSKYTCERLSVTEAHKSLLKSFANNRNPHLIEYLNQNGWDEDSENSTAFYIVKDGNGFPMLFFSLKCGSLSQQLDEVKLQQQKMWFELAKRILSNPTDKEEIDMATMILEKFRGGQDLSYNDIKQLLATKAAQKHDILQYVSDDKSKDPNRHIVRVGHTHSGIELVHICVNENAIALWKTHKFPQSLGKTMYWNFVIPIANEVRKHVGCKYLFLFAADNTEDGTLINYYNVSLHLDRPDHIGTSKPIYD